MGCRAPVSAQERLHEGLRVWSLVQGVREPRGPSTCSVAFGVWVSGLKYLCFNLFVASRVGAWNLGLMGVRVRVQDSRAAQ